MWKEKKKKKFLNKSATARLAVERMFKGAEQNYGAV